MLVRQILDQKGVDITTIHASATIADIVAILAEERIGAVVVIDHNGQIDGIVSERDVTRKLAEHGAEVLTMTAFDIMTVEVVTCHPDDDIDKLMRKMTAGRFRHLPVIGQGKILGIVSIGDIVKHRVEELENESSLLQEYIAGAA